MFADAIASVVNMVSAFHGFSIPNFIVQESLSNFEAKIRHPGIRTVKSYQLEGERLMVGPVPPAMDRK